MAAEGKEIGSGACGAAGQNYGAESTPSPEQLKALLSLTEEQFREQRIAVKIFSQVLGAEIYLISHPSLGNKVDGVSYLPEEIAELMKIRDALKPHYEERLQKIHNAKRIYGGKIIGGESGG